MDISFLEIRASDPVRKWVRNLFVGAAAVLGLLAMGIFALYKAAQREPEFYHQALLIQAAEHQEAGDDLEQNVFELHNEVRETGTWEATFTESQINGWLAADMPSKFPNVLPAGTQEPRVKIDPDSVRVACRFDNGKIKTVISFAVDVKLTSETNTLAIRISKLRAGALPVPLKQVLDKVTSAANHGDIPLRWSQADGDPVALVTVPVTHADYAHHEIYVDTIELREGELYLAGHTDRQPSRRLQTAGMAQTEENSTLHR